MNNRKTPRIRFKGFTDDWEQRKLSSLCDKFTDGDWIEAKDQTNSGVRLIQTGNVGVAEYLDKSNNKKWISNDTFEALHCEEVFEGDILISRLPEPAGRACIIPNLASKMITAVDCTIVRVSNDISNKFLLQYLSSQKYFDEVNTCLAGGTRQRISRSSLANFDVAIPVKKSEQEAIGAYFSHLDHLITLHQRKLEKLKIVKKAMLENCFPKNGEKIPKFRFSGFTGDWEQRKLSELYATIGNAFVGTATPYYVESGHFYLESNNIKDGQINYSSEIFVNDEFYEKQRDKWLHTGDMVMVQSGHVGHAAVIPAELDNSAAHALIMFRNPKEKIEPYFLNYQYQTNKSKNKIESITTGNTIKHILSSDMQEFIVDMPDYNEQKKIGQYFSHLDHLITLHQRKLEKLKIIKKSFLEKMFV